MLEQDRHQRICDAIYRMVTFFDVLGYAPLWVECTSWIEWGVDDGPSPSADEFVCARDALIARGSLQAEAGRIARQGSMEGFMRKLHDADVTFPRKLRRARRVAKWLSFFAGVRFVALVNTTALGVARDASDLDFFVIVRDGSMWSIRLFGGAPYRIFGRLASATGDDAAPDAVCLSYFMTDANLDLASHMLPSDDPYFRYWFLSMLPLFDDGISKELWERNAIIRDRHTLASSWISSPDIAIRVPRIRYQSPQWVERFARWFQMRWFPARIRDRMNRDTTVIVNDQVLKFHVDDGRAKYREAYEKKLIEK